MKDYEAMAKKYGCDAVAPFTVADPSPEAYNSIRNHIRGLQPGIMLCVFPIAIESSPPMRNFSCSICQNEYGMIEGWSCDGVFYPSYMGELAYTLVPERMEWVADVDDWPPIKVTPHTPCTS